MRTISLCSIAIFLLVSSSGCVTDPSIDLIRSGISTTNEISDILAQIDDSKSANVWKKKLKKLHERLKEIVSDIKKKDKPTDEEFAEREELFKKDLANCLGRLNTEARRIMMNEETKSVLDEYFRSLSEITVEIIPPPEKNQQFQRPGGDGPNGPMGGPNGPGGGPNGPGMGPNGPGMGPNKPGP